MSNPHKGEVDLKVGDSTYTLRFSIDALCQLEDADGRGFPQIAADLSDPQKVRLSLLRDLLWAGLRDRHPEITLKEAGELMVSAGGMAVVMAKVTDALDRAFKTTEASGTPRPSPPPDKNHPMSAGTGPDS